MSLAPNGYCENEEHGVCCHDHPAHFGSLIQVEYRAKHRKEGSHGLSMLGRPDIEMAKKAARLSSQVREKGKQ